MSGDPPRGGCGSTRPRVAVVGGGISGLAAALHLRDLAARAGVDLDLTLVEADRSPGGKVRTDRVAGLVIEQGADAFLTDRPWAVELCRRLGLSDAMVRPAEAARRVYTVHRGRLVPLPDGLALGVPLDLGALWRTPLLSPWGKVRAALEPLVPPSRAAGDEPLAAYLRRRLGREASERLAEPLLGALYGGSADELSAAAVAPRLRELERRYGSLWRGLRRVRGAGGRGGPPFASLRGGLATLVEAAAAALAGARIACGVRAEALRPLAGGRYALRSADGAEEAFDAVVLAVPAPAAAQLLEPLAPRAAELLAGVRYAPSLVVALAFPPGAVALPEGSGFIVPAAERRMLSACTWVSRKWPHCAPGGEVLLRCFVAAAAEPGVSGRGPAGLRPGDGELAAGVLEELRALLGRDAIRAAPGLVRVYRWPEALPCYAVGHGDRVAAILRALEEHPAVALAGSAYRGVGIPDCIRQGREAAEQVAARLGWAPGREAGPAARVEAAAAACGPARRERR